VGGRGGKKLPPWIGENVTLYCRAKNSKSDPKNLNWQYRAWHENGDHRSVDARAAKKALQKKKAKGGLGTWLIRKSPAPVKDVVQRGGLGTFKSHVQKDPKRRGKAEKELRAQGKANLCLVGDVETGSLGVDGSKKVKGQGKKHLIETETKNPEGRPLEG